MRNVIICVITGLALSVCGGGLHSVGAEPPAPREDEQADAKKMKASVWMKHKLVASQKILEAMTRADYQQIEKNAQDMRVMGHLEEWLRADVAGYREQLRAFDHANSSLVRAAQEKNLDAVTIAYAQLMISCVQCHKIVRDKVTQ